MPKDGNVIVVRRVSTPYLHFEYYNTVQEENTTNAKKKKLKRINIDTNSVSTNYCTPVKSDIDAKDSVQSVHRCKTPNQKVDQKMEEKIIKMRSKKMKLSAIAKKLHISGKTVGRTIKRLKEEGRLIV